MQQACSLSALLQSSGWNGDPATTAQVVSWLAEQDLPDTASLVGLEFGDLEDSSRWGPGVPRLPVCVLLVLVRLLLYSVTRWSERNHQKGK